MFIFTHLKILILSLLCFSVWGEVFAQVTTIRGKVTDAETADAVPFANVMFKGTNIGAVTDFEGFFQLSTNEKLDSLTVSYVGYKPKTKVVEIGKAQTINFQLFPNTELLDEVVVTASSENPAWEILREVVKNKKENNGLQTILAYEYEKYTRVELDVDNISDKFRKKK